MAITLCELWKPGAWHPGVELRSQHERTTNSTIDIITNTFACHESLGLSLTPLFSVSALLYGVFYLPTARRTPRPPSSAGGFVNHRNDPAALPISDIPVRPPGGFELTPSNTPRQKHSALGAALSIFPTEVRSLSRHSSHPPLRTSLQ